MSKAQFDDVLSDLFRSCLAGQAVGQCLDLAPGKQPVDPGVTAAAGQGERDCPWPAAALARDLHGAAESRHAGRNHDRLAEVKIREVPRPVLDWLSLPVDVDAGQQRVFQFGEECAHFGLHLAGLADVGVGPAAVPGGFAHEVAVR